LLENNFYIYRICWYS